MLGKPENHPFYGWDNEYGKHEELCGRLFETPEFLISNGEYLEFVHAGGYHTREYWTRGLELVLLQTG